MITVQDSYLFRQGPPTPRPRPVKLTTVWRVTTDSGSRGRAPSALAASGGPVSNALIRATRLHRLRARQLLQSIGLYPGHELLLMRLWDSGPQRQADLAIEFDTDSASMTRTVQRLERAGFVRRRSDRADRRVTLVESTAAGMALRDRIEDLWTQLEADTVGEMPASEQEHLLKGLEHLESNLAAAV